MLIRFVELCERLGWRGGVEDAYRELYDAYAGEGRYYHTLEHVGACLADFDEVAGLAEKADWVEMAIWYHDVVYDVRRGDNEEVSRQIAMGVCEQAGMSRDAVVGIGELILVTRHDGDVVHRDQAIMVDVDLAILGKEEDVYDRYEAAIRKEYAFVDEGTYREGRRAVLKGFLDRPTIYCLSYFQERYQEQAVRNLERAMRGLM